MDERHEKILGTGFDQNFDPEMWSVRTNTILKSVDDFKSSMSESGFSLEPIPWSDVGFWIKTEDVVTSVDGYKRGHFFSQNASSMIPPITLNPSEEDVVLDMAASPGSKTTQMAAMMNNKGVIVANDLDMRRLLALRGNLQRCCVMNTTVTNKAAEDIWRTGVKFDKILLDAPCTGTGTMRPGVMESTGEAMIKSICKKQKVMLSAASKSLQEDGTIVYSTCSLEPEENEGVVDYGINELGLKTEKINLDIPRRYLAKVFTGWEGSEFDSSVSDSLRILPTNKTEGFFVCKLKK